MYTVVLVIEIILAVALVGVVLIQKSEGGALGMGGGGGGGMSGFMTGRSTANLLTRTTAIIAILFFITCIGLDWLAAHQHPSRATIDLPISSAPGTPAPATAPGSAPATTPPAGSAPAEPAAPAQPATPTAPLAK